MIPSGYNMLWRAAYKLSGSKLSDTHLKWALTFEWSVVRCGSKNGH